MKTRQDNRKFSARAAIFLFFVTALFLMQIAFAFTIHGDIGSNNSIIPIIDRPASPILVGKIDGVVSDSKTSVATRVAPEGAFAPAVKNLPIENIETIAKIDTEISTKPIVTAVIKKDGERFYDYEVQRGDTLEKISKRLFGNNNMIQPIVRINRIRNERGLRLGEIIKVPREGILRTVKIN